jgi:hypothetical protein
MRVNASFLTQNRWIFLLKMENKVNNRIQQIVDEQFKGNISKFSRTVDIPQTTLSSILGKRESAPSYDVLNKIVGAKALNISAEWLLTGEGEMQISSNRIEGMDEVTYLKNLVMKQQDTIHELTLLLKKTDVLRAGTACSADAETMAHSVG